MKHPMLLAPATTTCAATPATAGAREVGEVTESLFERFGWFYGFLRERVFQDDTDRIAQALWPLDAPLPSAGQRLVEIGCGPGFYARRLAARFPALEVIGVDRSPAQLGRAGESVRCEGLTNCRFQQADAHALPWPAEAMDAVLASRLFTILPEREAALAEMHRVLRPGGRCFLAEPRSLWRAAWPLRALWLLARVVPAAGEPRGSTSARYREPARPAVFDPGEFSRLVASQPWSDVRRWEDGNYQYALCVKASGSN